MLSRKLTRVGAPRDFQIVVPNAASCQNAVGAWLWLAQPQNTTDAWQKILTDTFQGFTWVQPVDCSSPEAEHVDSCMGISMA